MKAIVHPLLTLRMHQLNRGPTQARHPCGTQATPFTAASFRTSRGSRGPAAQDPTINVDPRDITRTRLRREREFSPAIADCGYRAPLAPRLARSRKVYPGTGPIAIPEAMQIKPGEPRVINPSAISKGRKPQVSFE